MNRITRISFFAVFIYLICCILLAPNAFAYVDPVSTKPVASRVLRGFDPPAQRWEAGHRGVDLANTVGDNVYAAGAGTVAFTGIVAGKPVVSIDHADGIRTTYEPVFSQVNKGEKIEEGALIGTLAPANNGKPGLHWGARTGKDDYLNPLSLLESPTIRLKPLAG